MWRDCTTNRIDWPLCCVVDLLAGKDQRVQLARVKRTRDELLKPVKRLFSLEYNGVASKSDQVAMETIKQKTYKMTKTFLEPKLVRECSKLLDKM